jgi:hypothetical protein
LASPRHDLTRYDINNIWIAADLRAPTPKVDTGKLPSQKEYSSATCRFVPGL